MNDTMRATRQGARRVLAASRAFASFDPAERVIAVEAAWTLLLTRARAKSGRTLADATELGTGKARRATACDVAMICRIATSVADLVFPASRCLERSVSIGRILRRRGVDASVVIGIQLENGTLQGHAWLESDGLPLGTSPELPLRFARVPQRSLRDYEWSRGIVWQKT